jgi:hypothetical protein
MTSPSQAIIRKPVRYIILDTCIFKLLNNAELEPQIIQIFREVVSKGYSISISQYSIFEMLNTSTVENEMKAMEAVRGLRQFRVNQSNLIAAGHLGCLYETDGLEVKMHPEVGDKVIGAASIIHNTLIFTTNGRHYPSPFFNTISKPVLKYKRRDDQEVYLVTYFIEPDRNLITTKHNERSSELSLKSKK